MSNSKTERIRSLLAEGYTQGHIALQVGLRQAWVAEISSRESRLCKSCGKKLWDKNLKGQCMNCRRMCQLAQETIGE